MMILKLIPGTEVQLPLAAYYGITFMSLSVGNSGVTACSVSIGDKVIEFRPCQGKDSTMLYPGGDPGNNPTYRLKTDGESIILSLPGDQPTDTGDNEFELHHYLSYTVPVKDGQKAPVFEE